jgi:hypothetical protein
MTNLRDKISDAIPPFYDDRLSPDDIADAILAALPDMIAPLVWEEDGRHNYLQCKGARYQVAWNGDGTWRVRLDSHVIFRSRPSLIEAKDAANAHHRAAIMAAFTGVAT